MKFVKEPKNFETEKWNYLVIGYFNEKAIVKNEEGQLYFVRCEEQAAPIGTVIPDGMAEPVEKLSDKEQELIQDIYGNKAD